MQLCGRCREEKPADAFIPSKRGKAGAYCKVCWNAYQRAYRKVAGTKPQQNPARPAATEYRAVHHRVAKARGPANQHLCGCGADAQDWAYDGSDPSPLRGRTPGGTEVAYSADPARYRPMCRPCHVRFDGAANRKTRDLLAAAAARGPSLPLIPPSTTSRP